MSDVTSQLVGGGEKLSRSGLPYFEKMRFYMDV